MTPGGSARFVPVAPTIKDTFPVHLDAKAQCPKFAGRVIRGVNNKATSPIWLRERLRRCGVRSISPVVDVTNYILLELGQPMHAYDLEQAAQRDSRAAREEGEKITLLDGRTVDAASDVLFITDGEGPIGAAGIMGGERTSVTPDTTDVFFEVAYFAPDAIRGRGRRWGLVTDAGQRYERGVDPALQERAIERATRAAAADRGRSAGPRHGCAVAGKLADARAGEAAQEPAPAPARCHHRSGPREVDADLAADAGGRGRRRLGRDAPDVPLRHRHRSGPHRRGRAHRRPGRDRRERRAGPAAIQFVGRRNPGRAGASSRRSPRAATTKRSTTPSRIRRANPVCSRIAPGLLLANAISADLSVMRVSLWPGLLNNVLLNQRRQQERVRLFEHGTRFETKEGGTREIDTLAGVAAGPRLPEQWGLTKEARANVDFFDVKADVEALIAGTGAPEEFTFHAPSLTGAGTAHAGSATNNANNAATRQARLSACDTPGAFLPASRPRGANPPEWRRCGLDWRAPSHARA